MYWNGVATQHPNFEVYIYPLANYYCLSTPKSYLTENLKAIEMKGGVQCFLDYLNSLVPKKN